MAIELKIHTPFEFFTDTNGKALENGKIYIGEGSLEPIGNPITVYSDRNLTQAVSQPIRTIGGYPVTSSTFSPISLFIDEINGYSILVTDKNDNLVYSSLNESTKPLIGISLGVVDPAIMGVDAPLHAIGYSNEAQPRYFVKTGAGDTEWVLFSTILPLNVADPIVIGVDAPLHAIGYSNEAQPRYFIKTGETNMDWKLFSIIMALGVANPITTGASAPLHAIGYSNEAQPRYFIKTGSGDTEWNRIALDSDLLDIEPISYWVDSAGGNDSNDGLSEAAPKQTFSSLGLNLSTDRVTVYVKCNSVFREQLTLGDYCQVLPYSKGSRPVFNAADIAPNVSFSLSGGQTNTYEITWAYEDTTSDVVSATEDDVPLKWVNSIVDCDLTPGSFYNSGSTSPNVIYIHASDSSNVVSNGKTYEIAKRSHGIKLGDNCEVRGVDTKNNTHDGGSLVVGSNFSGKDLVIQYGTKHCMYANENLRLVNVLFDHCNNKNTDFNAAHLVLYNDTLDNGYLVLDNVHFKNRRDISRKSYALIVHNANNSSKIDYAQIKNSTFENLTFCFANLAVSDVIHLKSCQFVECGRIKDLNGSSSLWFFESCRFYLGSTATMSSSNYLGGVNGASNAKFIMRGCFFNTAITRLFYGGFELFDVRYCSFLSPQPITAGFEYSLFDGKGLDLVGEATGKFIFKHNIVSGWEQPWRLEATSFDGWGVLDVDYNYYIINGSSAGLYDFITNNTNFTTWQTDTGQDANSLETNESAVAFVPFKEAADVQISAMPIIAGHLAWEGWGQSAVNDDFEIPAIKSISP